MIITTMIMTIITTRTATICYLFWLLYIVSTAFFTDWVCYFNYLKEKWLNNQQDTELHCAGTTH